MRSIFRRLSTSAVALGLSLWCAASPSARAASISYGNFGPIPPGYSFLDVRESSGTDGVPLYGAPTPFSILPNVAGLDFNPTSFIASSAGGIDVTDGQLNFMLVNPQGISSIKVSEAGNFSLSGIGTSATHVIAGASMIATVTQVNGVDVVPFVWGSPVNTSVTFDLISNPGLVQPWSLDLQAFVGLGPGLVPTKVNVVIDNQLLSLSEIGTIASITKTDFVVTTGVPEPSALLLGNIALGGIAIRARTSARSRA